MRTPRFSVWQSVAALLILILALGTTPVAAQFGGIGDAARRAQEALRKKREAEDQAKKEKEAEAQKAAEAKKAAEAAKKEQPAAAAPAPAAAAPASASSAGAVAPADVPPAFQAFSKYDFVPGELVVALEDFTQDAVGDFPARWNTNGSGEIVTIAGQPGRWLKLTRAGFFLPEFITELPDNFTLEFDLMVAPTFDSGPTLNVALTQLANPKDVAPWQTSPNIFTVTLTPGPAGGSTGMVTRQESTSASANSADTAQLTAKRGRPVHVSFWRQRQRVRVYINEDKAWDVPRALDASAKLNSLIFFVPGTIEANDEYYVTNVRLATGAPDTRNKIVTEGKWVTRGILFDVNSDRIKGESYGSLKEMAGVLTESADVKVVIVGHTDADGEAAANLDLSKRRAASVKTALATEFKIDAGRMDTDGKGESEPVDKNDTPAGKANNRRVEFIRR